MGTPVDTQPRPKSAPSSEKKEFTQETEAKKVQGAAEQTKIFIPPLKLKPEAK